MYCPNCSVQLPDMSKFCSKCGNSLPYFSNNLTKNKRNVISKITDNEVTVKQARERNGVSAWKHLDNEATALWERFLSALAACRTFKFFAENTCKKRKKKER